MSYEQAAYMSMQLTIIECLLGAIFGLAVGYIWAKR